MLFCWPNNNFSKFQFPLYLCMLADNFRLSRNSSHSKASNNSQLPVDEIQETNSRELTSLLLQWLVCRTVLSASNYSRKRTLFRIAPRRTGIGFCGWKIAGIKQNLNAIAPSCTRRTKLNSIAINFMNEVYSNFLMFSLVLYCAINGNFKVRECN